MTRPLDAFLDSELAAELDRRRKQRQAERQPVFRCANCGETADYSGWFSPAKFQAQKERFDAVHRDCQPLVDGGGI